MAGILHRTVFAEFTKDAEGKKYLRFADWALVQTGLGLMAEPFHANQRIGAQGWANQTATDFEDQISMINAIEFVNMDTLPTMLSGGSGNGPVLHNGNQLPRLGR